MAKKQAKKTTKPKTPRIKEVEGDEDSTTEANGDE